MYATDINSAKQASSDGLIIKVKQDMNRVTKKTNMLFYNTSWLVFIASLNYMKWHEKNNVCTADNATQQLNKMEKPARNKSCAQPN